MLNQHAVEMTFFWNLVLTLVQPHPQNIRFGSATRFNFLTLFNFSIFLHGKITIPQETDCNVNQVNTVMV
jgi:hypothetical protein